MHFCDSTLELTGRYSEPFAIHFYVVATYVDSIHRINRHSRYSKPFCFVPFGPTLCHWQHSHRFGAEVHRTRQICQRMSKHIFKFTIKVCTEHLFLRFK